MGLFYGKTMDPDELELYLDAIDAMDPLLRPSESADDGFMLHEQLRDMHGHRVEGCSQVRPMPTE